MSSSRALFIAHFALLGVAIIYGSSFLIAKGAMTGAVPPRAFIQFRVTGAALLFWSFVLATFVPMIVVLLFNKKDKTFDFKKINKEVKYIR